ncbi:hypothetical protein IFM89_021176, partial [Coptis chinensis]
TVKYNMKVKAGRAFYILFFFSSVDMLFVLLLEGLLKTLFNQIWLNKFFCYYHAMGIPKKLAPTIGIAVVHHRKNRSLEGLQANALRLKTYKANPVYQPLWHTNVT